QAVRLRARVGVRRPRGADVRRPRLPAHERGRALPARAARRPHLGGHERDPAADRRSRARTSRSGADTALDDRFHDPRPRLGASRGAGSPPTESARGSATVPIARATSCIHGTRPCGHAGRGIDHLMHRLLNPRSVAVVGASDRPDTYSSETLLNLRRLGFPGDVWGVNPGRASAHGVPCFPSLGDLPGVPDAVVVAIPAPGVPAVIEEAGALGCGGAVVYGAGFGETADGVALEESL